jgi:aspartokinase
VIVMKFGGTSVGGTEQLGRVADRVLDKRAQQPCVVVSAMGKTTDALFAAARTARSGDIDAALATIAPALGHAEAVAGELLGQDDAPALAAIAVVRDELH